MTLRIDPLNGETMFHVVECLTSDDALTTFENRLLAVARGYTRYKAVGGWRPLTGIDQEDYILVYRVASLTLDQINELATYLILHTGMRDLYVVSNGQAFGYSIEDAPARATDSGRFHGTRDTGWRK